MYALIVFKVLQSFLLPYTIINFLLPSLKLLTNFENAYLTLLGIPSSVIGRCSLVPTSYWIQGKFARITLFQAASCMILQNHRRLPVSIFSVKIAALGSLKRVTGRIFKINLKGAS
jgi:hypothetical protein